MATITAREARERAARDAWVAMERAREAMEEADRLVGYSVRKNLGRSEAVRALYAADHERLVAEAVAAAAAFERADADYLAVSADLRAALGDPR